MRAAREGNVLLVVLLAASAAAGAGPRLQVRHDGDARVTVRYELEEPVTELRFLVDQPDVRLDGSSISTTSGCRRTSPRGSRSRTRTTPRVASASPATT